MSPSDRSSVPLAEPVAKQGSRVTLGSARALLLTVLGDFVVPNEGPVWTSSLLHVLEGLGISEKAARQAISRSAAAGWIEGERAGREVRWHVSCEGRRLIDEGVQRVFSLSGPREPWDGRWLILAFTVPTSHRTVRRKLYRALAWAGLGSPLAGVWLTPNIDREREAREAIEKFELEEHTLSFVGNPASIGLSDERAVRQSWDLHAIASYYIDALGRFQDLDPRDPDDILFTEVAVANELQRFPFIDPQLPDELLPEEWIGRDATEIFERLRERWRAPAQARWRELDGKSEPGQVAEAG